MPHPITRTPRPAAPRPAQPPPRSPRAHRRLPPPSPRWVTTAPRRGRAHLGGRLPDGHQVVVLLRDALQLTREKRGGVSAREGHPHYETRTRQAVPTAPVPSQDPSKEPALSPARGTQEVTGQLGTAHGCHRRREAVGDVSAGRSAQPSTGGPGWPGAPPCPAGIRGLKFSCP